MTFPADFIWGAATSSYQIEGETPEAGRGECIWTRFSRQPGTILDSSNGLIACDHYHRYRDDIALMRDLGLNGYRFSTSWARVLPDGERVNEEGLDFYDRLVDASLEAGLRPFLTLYHWDLPTALYDRGGWGSPDSVEWFAKYADLMANRLGDRVKDWVTHNEPWCTSFLGHYYGAHAPGEHDFAKALRVAHHVLLSHGAAVPLIRSAVPDARVGIAINLYPIYAASDDPKDKLAAQYDDGMTNRWFLDPVYRGEYPADMIDLWRPYLDGIDLSAIKSAAIPLDFVGVNFYSRNVTRWDEDSIFKGTRIHPTDSAYTSMEWEIFPQGLAETVLRLKNEYNTPPLYITENGSAFRDAPPVNGQVDDPERLAYLRDHLTALEAAYDQGAPVAGYFVWSLMDNYEWAYGYTERFGVVYVDYETQERIPKASALWYRDQIKSRS